MAMCEWCLGAFSQPPIGEHDRPMQHQEGGRTVLICGSCYVGKQIPRQLSGANLDANIRYEITRMMKQVCGLFDAH